MINKKNGSMLLELVIALSLGILILVQVAQLITTFISHVHAAAQREHKALKTGVVLDVFMRDIAVAVQWKKNGKNPQEIISFLCWHVTKKQEHKGIYEWVTWSRVKGRLHRKSSSMSVSQVFGSVLLTLSCNEKNKTIRFLDDNKKEVIIEC